MKKITLFSLILTLIGCRKEEIGPQPVIPVEPLLYYNVLVGCEGNFGSSNGSVTVFDNSVYYIADTAYANEVSPFWSSGTITEITVALGQFNVVGSVAIIGSGSVEVIDATSHATLNLGDTVTLNA